MNEVEIKETYDSLENLFEVFESFEADNVNVDSIAEVLGDDVAGEYASWLYLNVK